MVRQGVAPLSDRPSHSAVAPVTTGQGAARRTGATHCRQPVSGGSLRLLIACSGGAAYAESLRGRSRPAPCGPDSPGECSRPAQCGPGYRSRRRLARLTQSAGSESGASGTARSGGPARQAASKTVAVASPSSAHRREGRRPERHLAALHGTFALSAHLGLAVADIPAVNRTVAESSSGGHTCRV